MLLQGQVIGQHGTDGQQFLDRRAVNQDVDKIGVGQKHYVKNPAAEIAQNGPGNVGNVQQLRVVRQRGEVGNDLLPVAQHLVTSLAAYGDQLNRSFLNPDEIKGGADDVVIIAAAQPPVGGDEHQSYSFDGTLLEEGMQFLPGRALGGQVGQYIPGPLRIGAGSQYLILGTPHFGGGYHLHGPRDLRDAFNAADAPPYLA